ncbi:MAG: hypothetical protein WC959_12785, partial [Kiritimatiellales bacterium]
NENIVANINGQKETIPLQRLIAGAHTGHLGDIDSPCYRFSRAPLPHELNYQFTVQDSGDAGDFYYLRVRQKDDQWAWSSPIFFRCHDNSDTSSAVKGTDRLSGHVAL